MLHSAKKLILQHVWRRSRSAQIFRQNFHVILRRGNDRMNHIWVAAITKIWTTPWVMNIDITFAKMVLLLLLKSSLKFQDCYLEYSKMLQLKELPSSTFSACCIQFCGILCR
ncbi:uncharacterized protein LOC108214465 [Daucus carota subsp. sativus]|uniref:uncharacterized protein LOC108214465 n=1 Tax=Daucus carota subsp. sativus TaxID=79200 RepID=UPI003083CF05